MSNIAPKAGDILLMMSTDELSKLIAWFGDSQYSHSALMTTDEIAMEAIANGVTKTTVDDFRKPDFKVKYLDVFRTYDRNGNPCNEEQLQAIKASAELLAGIPFEFGKLVQIGVFSAVRQKIPTHPIARRLLRLAFDHILANSDKAMTCSQFVYTAFLRATTVAEVLVLPRITVSGPSGLPFPDDIDWLVLIKEVKELLSGHDGLEVSAWESYESMSDEVQLFSDHVLKAKAAEVLTVLGLNDEAQRRISRASQDNIIENPNPKLVTPEDLHRSPDHLPLGRWYSI